MLSSLPSNLRAQSRLPGRVQRRRGARARSGSPRSRVCRSPRGTIIRFSHVPHPRRHPRPVRDPGPARRRRDGGRLHAWDPRFDRQVAIKVLPPDLTRDKTAKQRFLHEAKAASALDHPNIWAISGLPKGRKYLISQSFLGKVSVRPAQVGGVDVNTFLSELNWLLRMPNVDRILPRGRVATVRQGPRTVCKQARNRPLPRVTATARPARPIWTASAGSADVVPGDDANACVPTTYTVRVADLRAKLSWTTVV